MGKTSKQPLHASVDALLEAIIVRGPKRAEAPAAALATMRERLLVDGARDATSFLHLAAAWVRFSKSQVQPITGQLLELLRLMPGVTAGASDAQVEKMARGLATKSKNVSNEALNASVSAPKPIGTGLRRSR